MNSILLGDLDYLPEQDKLRMFAMIDHSKSAKGCINSLVEGCFNDCADTFKHKSLQEQEETCQSVCREVLKAFHANRNEVC